MDRISLYKTLSNLFSENGYQLYLVGGTVRDFLLGIELSDMDCASDATPEEMKEFLQGDYTFSKYGTVKTKLEGISFEITSFREEKGYLDSRHPNTVEFVKDIKKDYLRRDFTVNAMYLDKNLQVIDFVNGQEDLKNKILRMVGNPETRIKEDPLRIVRAVRFALEYNLSLDEDLINAIKNNKDLLNNLNPEKIKMDLKKLKCKESDKIIKLFTDLDIKYLLDMIE